MAHSNDTKQQARNYYLKGWTIIEIAKTLGVSERTCYLWRESERWDDFCPPDTAEIALSRRILLLSERENKTKAEIEELERLIRVMGDFSVKLATAKKIAAEAVYIEKNGALPVSENKRLSEDTKKPRKAKAVKNDVSGISTELLDEVRLKVFFAYQLLWYSFKYLRTRFILKSRQIGATWYFAFEALDDAIRTGDNQLFLSASRDQAEVFKAYIIAIAKQHFDLELKGTGVILLSNGAELRFLSTNSTTAQSYHGHLYMDEVFWIPNFEKVYKVASGMATHKKWRKTLFSTPSAQSHPAYKIWSGEKYNARLSEKKRAEFDVSHQALKDGAIGADKIWRNIVDIYDADKIIKAEILEGTKPKELDFFDIEELITEFSKDEFDNLYGCKFIDDSRSVFNLDMLFKCAVDVPEWIDYKEKAARPFGNKPVAIGFDPSRTGDNTSCAILEIPANLQNSFRLLKKHTYHGRNLDYQANRIKEITESHNVQHIGIDTTGMGLGVFELVEAFYPLATPIHYSVDIKNRLVLKALDLISNQRFSFLAGDNDVIRAFLMIVQKVTDNGAITYQSLRTVEGGHADLAWAIMHGFAYEPIRPRATATASFSN